MRILSHISTHTHTHIHTHALYARTHAFTYTRERALQVGLHANERALAHDGHSPTHPQDTLVSTHRALYEDTFTYTGHTYIHTHTHERARTD